MKAILIMLSALAFALSPFLSPSFSGFDPNRYPVPQINPAVQPAGWAFSIWGAIYIGLIIHAIFGLFQHRDDEAWDKGRISLFISLGIGTFWLPNRSRFSNLGNGTYMDHAFERCCITLSNAKC